MKKLSLIAIATLMAGAASAADSKIYARADYGLFLDNAKNGSVKSDTAFTFTGNVGFGVNYGGFVVEVPDLDSLNKAFLGWSFDLTNEFSLTPKLAYRWYSKGSTERSALGAKLEAEYKVAPAFGLALTFGKFMTTTETYTTAKTDETALTFGGKFYF